ncbi:IS3 family transposase [Sporosarcina sp. P17b]|uniref:IS3 family transposase n=1 Tax=Sporosarcina sp. P17b TaxID=2048260 RepID=UPI000C16D067|nr:IS3 family transposase [Sporosarcina sp. P17b]PIC72981.1 transposase [Sporosarcina sp. P17b]
MESLRPFVKTPKVPRDQLRDELKRLQEIEKKYNEQLTEIEILKKVPSLSQGEGKQKAYEAITALRKVYTVKQLCKAIGVSRSGYYAYLKRPKKEATSRDQEDIIEIKKIVKENRGTCGAKRISGVLRAANYIINHKRVARLMKELNIRSKIRRKKYTKENRSKATGYIYPNLLARDFNALLPNCKWVMDVTEFIRGDEKVFVSAIMDLYDRNPIEVLIGRTSNNEMMEESIRKAMKERNLKDLSGVILHTDRGNSYRSHRYNQLSKKLGFIPSMSRKANCWDNAVIESFFSHFKTELPYHYSIETPALLEQAIPKFITYYKEIRSQKRLGYLSPEAFLASYLKRA